MKLKSSFFAAASLVASTLSASNSFHSDPVLFQEFIKMYEEFVSKKGVNLKATTGTPSILGTISAEAGTNKTGFIVSAGTTAYVPTLNPIDLGLSSYPWISVFDISVPGSITNKGTLTVAGFNNLEVIYPRIFINGSNTTGIFLVQDPTLSQDTGVGVLDLSTPGTVSIPASGTVAVGSGLGNPNFVAFIDGTTWQLTSYTTGDVAPFNYATFPFVPGPVANITPGATPQYMLSKGTTVFLGDSLGTITAINAVDPGAVISAISSTATDLTSGGVTFLLEGSANALYALSGQSNKLATIDISDPYNLNNGTSIDIAGDPLMMQISGTTGYVVCSNSGNSTVALLNLSTPLAPTLIGSVFSGGYKATDLKVNGSLLYLAHLQTTNDPLSQGLISYFDISTPGTATLLGTFTTQGIGANSFVFQGTTGFVSNGGDATSDLANIGYFFAPDAKFIPPEPPVPPTPSLPSYSGNLGEIGYMLTSVYNQPGTPQATNAIAQGIFEETNSLIQQEEMVELMPGFKIIQYSLEKQDLLLHKEVERELYEKENKSSFFMLAGYDNLTQKSKGVLTGLNGYNVNTPYQMIGFNQKYSKLKLIETIAGSESFMQVSPAHARARFYTVWGDIGIAYVSSKWQVGLDGQYGYSFLNTKRYIDSLGLKATSNHNAWNASGLLRIGYDIVRDNSSVTPYNNLSYIYGRENNYTENGAPGANLNVKDESISTIRNQAGFKIKKPVSRYAHILFDGAWLYEKYLNDQNYSASFVGTNVFGSFRQIVPTKNYARFEAGFIFRKDRLDLEFIYTGLYGRKFAESSGSMKFGYKY